MLKRSWLLAPLAVAVLACSASSRLDDEGTIYNIAGFGGGSSGNSGSSSGMGGGGSNASGSGGMAGSGGTVDNSASGGSGGQTFVDTCPDAAKLVYVVDQDGRFSSFNPRTKPPTFIDITKNLNCPAALDVFGIKTTPFSMSVDRNAVAWVLYTSGELFRVDTADGSCKATSFQPNQSGFQLMGMGFVANSKMSTLDTLYVAGGAGPNAGAASRLGTVDMNTLTVTPLQQLTGWPELTGTGLAELWGFYPDTTPPKVAKINKTTGAEEIVYPLASLQGVPAAWAFAFWGGDFWVFLMRETDTDTTVYRVKGSDGSMSVALANTARKIVGAGVSTCAPVVLE